MYSECSASIVYAVLVPFFFFFFFRPARLRPSLVSIPSHSVVVYCMFPACTIVYSSVLYCIVVLFCSARYVSVVSAARGVRVMPRVDKAHRRAIHHLSL